MAGQETFDYASAGADDIRRGCEEALRQADRLVDTLIAVPDAKRTFENTLGALEQIDDILTNASGRYGFLSQVAAEKGVRETAHEWEEKLDTYATQLGFREEIDRALKAYAAKAETEGLGPEASRLLEFTQRDYRRNGMDLAPETRARVRELRERLVSLGIQFRRNIDEYEDAILVDRDGLAGLPDSFVENLRTEGEGAAQRYHVSLDYPEMFPFLETADHAGLREELFRKNHNKAADTNVAILEEAIALRDEAARLLGYPSWAAYILEIRMAKTPETVQEFLLDLEQRVRVKADKDLEQLRAAKQRHGGNGRIDIWDWRYFTNRVLREEHQVDPFAVAEYFSLEAVLEGMFDVYQRLVGVRFVPVEPHDGARPWHPDVRFYDVHDERSGELVSQFYMDLHPRPGKFGHAAAFTLRSGRQLPDGSYQRPISAIVANFTKPTAQSPSLLRHSEVVTLFHEFGHILHQTLTRAPYIRFSGTRVERDFVEAPSQMLEHWCWEKPVLQGFARHHRSGDPIPGELVDRMIGAKYVSSGIAALRQIYFARLDLAYHSGGRVDTDAIARELHPITAFDFPEDTHFQGGFGHLFGYDAGYYGYMWSRVFGDDMFTRFEGAGDAGVAAVGQDYRQIILAPGGTLDADEMVRRFLGREPSPEAFLRDLGLEPT